MRNVTEGFIQARVKASAVVAIQAKLCHNSYKALPSLWILRMWILMDVP